MKKIILILASLLAFMFIGCGESSTSDEKVTEVVNDSTTDDVEVVESLPPIPQVPTD